MPSRRWNKPSIMLTCEANYSNAHGTPWVYRHRNIGKLVGMPVPGTMTSVSWERLQDPSLVFGIPVVGYRLPDNSYLENSQLEPDIKVANSPETIVKGEDTQLKVAVEELLKELELDVSPNTTVSSLTVAKQQMIEIAKGISYDSKVLIMDEPTAALSINEIKDLFRVIQKLKAKGISIIYISHRLEELFEITDRITVMRDGAFINTFITKESSLPELIRSMVGREVSWEKKKHSNVAADAPVLLEVQGMESHAIKNASFKLRKGEILGIGGLMGAGRTELARLVFGADWRKHGKILKNGEEIQIRTPHDAVKNGIGYISEDRKALGLALKLSVADNIAMPNWEKFTSHGVVNEKEEMRVAAEMADRVMVKTPSVKQLVMNLSGGNQQKVAIAKWLLRDCDILIFDEPTRGIDIGAKSEIYNLINELIAQGKSIIMISSEMQELLSMSDRVIVMCEGSITGELDIADATQESIMALAVRRAV